MPREDRILSKHAIAALCIQLLFPFSNATGYTTRGGLHEETSACKRRHDCSPHGGSHSGTGRFGADTVHHRWRADPLPAERRLWAECRCQLWWRRIATVPLGSNGITQFPVDLGARYYRGGVASYLRAGGIQDNPDGSTSITPLTSRTPQVVYIIGMRYSIPYNPAKQCPRLIC